MDNIIQALQRQLQNYGQTPQGQALSNLPTSNYQRGSVNFSYPNIEQIIAQSPVGQTENKVVNAAKRTLGPAAPAVDLARAVAYSPYSVAKEAFQAGGNIPATLLNNQTDVAQKQRELALGTILPLGTLGATSALAGGLHLPNEAGSALARVGGAALRGGLAGAGFNVGSQFGQGVMAGTPIPQIAKQTLQSTPQAMAGGAIMGGALQGANEVGGAIRGKFAPQGGTPPTGSDLKMAPIPENLQPLHDANPV